MRRPNGDRYDGECLIGAISHLTLSVALVPGGAAVTRAYPPAPAPRVLVVGVGHFLLLLQRPVDPLCDVAIATAGESHYCTIEHVGWVGLGVPDQSAYLRVRTYRLDGAAELAGFHLAIVRGAGGVR